MKQMRIFRAFAALALFGWLLAAVPRAAAQDTRDGLWLDTVGPPAPVDLGRGPQRTGFPRPKPVLAGNGLPNILVTGYWPPTNEMLRQWSTDPNQNPGAWVGENWEGRGYNIYAFFPEFPGGTGVNPKGDGDFEVDYQDTSADWWFLLPIVRPIAITTTSRANTVKGWELEGGNRFYTDSQWSNDYLTPFDPTANEPSDPAGTERYSSLPIDAIVAAVATSGADVDPFSTTIDNGRFLSNYIGYHGNWWKELHDDPNMPDRCYAAGHIHVGGSAVASEATLAMEVTLRELIAHIDRLRFDEDGSGVLDFADAALLLGCMLGPDVLLGAPCSAMDTDQDVDGDLRDIAWMQRAFGKL